VFYIELFQGTPLLLQLFLVFFGLRLIASRAALDGRRTSA